MRPRRLRWVVAALAWSLGVGGAIPVVRAETPRGQTQPDGARPPLAPASGPARTSAALPAVERSRSGVLGWGLGLEAPMVGVIGGAGSVSSVGAGFTLGAALSWEVTPSVLVRIYGTWDQTRRGRARVTYVESGVRQASEQAADWLDFTLGAGGAYLFHPHPAWAPYVGADAGVTLIDGFEYRFDEEMEALVDDETQPFQYDDGRILGRSVGAMLNARVGVRMHLAAWLASMMEVSVSYVRNEGSRINNTLSGPDVRSVDEDIWLVRGTFSVRLGL